MTGEMRTAVHEDIIFQLMVTALGILYHLKKHYEAGNLKALLRAKWKFRSMKDMKVQ